MTASATALALAHRSVIAIWHDLGSIITPALLLPVSLAMLGRERLAPRAVTPLMLLPATVALVWVIVPHLPGRTGYQVAREIRRNEGGHRTVLVAVTGWSQLHDRELALAAGFDLHLTKPVSPSHLCRLLNGLVSAQTDQGATTAPSNA